MLEKENKTYRKQTWAMIIMIDLFVIVTLVLFLIFDLCKIGFETGHHDRLYFPYNVVPFDVIIQLVTLVATIGLPINEQRVRDRFLIGEDDYKILSGEDTKPLYIDALIIVCLLLVFDAVFYILDLAWSLNAIFICGLVLIVIFDLPCLIINICYEDHFIYIVEEQFHNYYLCDSSNKKLSTNTEYISKVNEIVTNVIDVMLVKYGYRKTFELLYKHY